MRDGILSLRWSQAKTLGNLAEAIGPAYYDDIWEFAVYISKGFEEEYLFVQDKKYFLHILCDLAVSTKKKRNMNKSPNRWRNKKAEVRR